MLELDVVIVGSIAYDDIESEAGLSPNTLGGSATYAGIACAFHKADVMDVGVVGVVGSDFSNDDWELLQSRGLDLKGVTRLDGLTFRWRGRYDGAMESAQTLETHLNVFEHFSPKIPKEWSTPRIVFCANIHPGIQRIVLDHYSKSSLKILDSMNLWIGIERDALCDVLRSVDIAILNEDEVMQLADDANIVRAARSIVSGISISNGKNAGKGPNWLIVKRGGAGVLAVSNHDLISLPAWPTDDLVDPTGCGDTFAGSFIAKLFLIEGEITTDELRSCLIDSIITASFTLSSFGPKGLLSLDKEQFGRRRQAYCTMLGY